MLSSGVYRKVASEKLGYSKPGITLDLYSGVTMQADAAIDGAVRAALNKRETKGWQNGSGHPFLVAVALSEIPINRGLPG